MSEKDTRIDIYTDGGCFGNPGPGAWAFVIICGSSVIKSSGCDNETTNNKMELMAVIKALEKFGKKFKQDDKYKATVFTDSIYVKNGITLWIKNWIRNGWRTSDRKAVKNRELWVLLNELSCKNSPEWQWVKGHAGDKWNEECDSLVQKEIKKMLKSS
jgi:ribonuclease HI